MPQIFRTTASNLRSKFGCKHRPTDMLWGWGRRAGIRRLQLPAPEFDCSHSCLPLLFGFYDSRETVQLSIYCCLNGTPSRELQEIRTIDRASCRERECKYVK